MSSRLDALPSRLGPSKMDFRQNQADRAFELLIKRYPCVARFYFPIELESARTGSDDMISYEETPDLEIQVLIPSIYNTRASGSDLALDDLLDDPKWMYLRSNQEIPLYSFVECVLPHTDTILNFKIDWTEERVGTLVLTQAYAIVPTTPRKVKNHQLGPVVTEYVPPNEADWGADPFDLSGLPDTISIGGLTEEIPQEYLPTQELTLNVSDGKVRNRRILRPMQAVEDDADQSR